MEKRKSGFGVFPEIGDTQWHYFQKNKQPVSVVYNGVRYVGMVAEIKINADPHKTYVRLQPSLIKDASEKELDLINKPIFVPFNSVPSSTVEDTLKEFLESYNRGEKLRRTQSTRRSPKQRKF